MNLDIDRIRSEFVDKRFVHIRNEQPMAASDLLALAESFGPLLETNRHTPDHPAIQIISDTGLFGDQDLPWHNDFSYGEGDFFVTLLCNRRNGEAAATSFVDMAVAAASPPPDVLLCDNFRVMHRRPPFAGKRELWRIQFAPWPEKTASAA